MKQREKAYRRNFARSMSAARSNSPGANDNHQHRRVGSIAVTAPADGPFKLRTADIGTERVEAMRAELKKERAAGMKGPTINQWLRLPGEKTARRMSDLDCLKVHCEAPDKRMLLLLRKLPQTPRVHGQPIETFNPLSSIWERDAIGANMGEDDDGTGAGGGGAGNGGGSGADQSNVNSDHQMSSSPLVKKKGGSGSSAAVTTARRRPHDNGKHEPRRPATASSSGGGRHHHQHHHRGGDSNGENDSSGGRNGNTAKRVVSQLMAEAQANRMPGRLGGGGAAMGGHSGSAGAGAGGGNREPSASSVTAVTFDQILDRHKRRILPNRDTAQMQMKMLVPKTKNKKQHHNSNQHQQRDEDDEEFDFIDDADEHDAVGFNATQEDLYGGGHSLSRMQRLGSVVSADFATLVKTNSGGSAGVPIPVALQRSASVFQ